MLLIVLVVSLIMMKIVWQVFNVKKLGFYFIILLILFLGVDSVFAICYEISDAHSYQVIGYTTNTADYSNSSDYRVNVVKDSLCNDDSTTIKKNSILNNKVSCGNIGQFHKKLPEITSWIVIAVQVIVPVILVIMGGIDFVKALSSQKEDEIKKGQQILVKRFIVAVIIFFTVSITKLLVGLVSSSNNESKSIISCIDCFISNKCN